ncbi:MAG: L-rhamnose mutarotase [Spirochaetota bacterium]
MRRVGFTMLLKAGNEAEYQKRHDEIWPELRRELAAAGVRDYTIFLDPETLVLFAFQRVAEPDATAELSRTEIMRKWWDYMADLMEVNPDNSPVVRPLREVFHLD